MNTFGTDELLFHRSCNFSDYSEELLESKREVLRVMTVLTLAKSLEACRELIKIWNALSRITC
ncbi:hypothetical protein PsorP6_000099 [Peronosclerospora sorghi]|uniref:Uncharacterized protein n=1 Tax=Peronosclerospora sorghi TaxID=230839 RepID=A0ACC0WUG6_9STRA|nr:hypothetical protein PsorP6_000099 [Peronosclerospora sorghi]